jgi:hypothetical protein
VREVDELLKHSIHHVAEDHVSTFQQRPDKLCLYLPSGEVHVLVGVSDVCLYERSRMLRFTDALGAVSYTTHPFTLTFSPKAPPKEATDA